MTSAVSQGLESHPQFENAIALRHDSYLTEIAETAAGCFGNCYVDIVTGELLLCDAGDLVLWRGQLELKK